MNCAPSGPGSTPSSANWPRTGHRPAPPTSRGILPPVVRVPVFVALEGGDGAGKTTQARMLVANPPPGGTEGHTGPGARRHAPGRPSPGIPQEQPQDLPQGGVAALRGRPGPAGRGGHQAQHGAGRIGGIRPVRRILHCLPGTRPGDRREVGAANQRLRHPGALPPTSTSCWKYRPPPGCGGHGQHRPRL